METRESSWSISWRPDSVFLVIWEARLACCAIQKQPRDIITEISSSHLYSNLIIKGTLDRNAIFVHYGHSINIRISLLKIKIVLIEKQLSISIYVVPIYLNIFYKLLHSLFRHNNGMCSVLTEVLNCLAGWWWWMTVNLRRTLQIGKVLFSSFYHYHYQDSIVNTIHSNLLRLSLDFI